MPATQAIQGRHLFTEALFTQAKIAFPPFSCCFSCLALVLKMVAVKSVDIYLYDRRPVILCLETGGTIASVSTNAGKRPRLSLEEIVENEMSEVLEFSELRFPEKGTREHFGKLIDSSNMQPEDWGRLAQSVYENLFHEHDGILITMGTDTMAYAASALSVMLSPTKPVVLTGSQRTLQDINSDAKENFLSAVLAASMLPPGVFLTFNRRVIDGRCATKISTTHIDAFCSINQPDVARVDIKERALFDASLPIRTNPQSPILDAAFDNSVKVETLVPGYEPAWLEAVLAREDIKGMVIQAFGLGGLPNSGRRQLIPVLQKYAQRKPIVVISQCLTGGTNLLDYEVGRSALAAGAISAGNLTLETASFRLKWLLSHCKSVEEIREAFNSSDGSFLTEFSGAICEESNPKK
jgi:L-asparaginase